MKTLAFAVAATALLSAGLTASQAATARNGHAPAMPPDSQNQLVGQYCATCHSDRGKAGGLTLAGFDAAKIDQHPDVAEQMIRKLRTGMMPPPDARRPDPATTTAFIDALETKMDEVAAVNPNPGWRPFQRLNRAEYQRAVHDLLGIDVDATAFLPPDTISKGFDNVADVQSFSPTLMESYLRAASQISRLAIGDRNASATSVTYKIGRTLSQMRHVDGAPIGTRGGLSVLHTFPADGDYIVKEEETCAAEIVTGLTGRAYRGAATPDDVQDAMQFYEQGRTKGDFENGIRMALQSVLMSPRFLFRLEQAPAALKTVKASQTYRIGDQELASRLSYFLWGTAPDADLMNAASLGALRTPAGLEKQVRRMIADRRSDALATRFAGQWLRLQDLEKIHPDYLIYPQYDDSLAQAMQRETELFFDSIVREDRPVLDLLTADYSFVNERLAKHYDIPNVAGSAFKRVQLPDYRRGLLGQGSILTLTSVADRTSPVQRGKWVMEVLLGSPPPPNVPALDDVKATSGGKMLSTRERMEEHRKNPACTSCHRVIDPLGLALENFDATGAWRIKDNEVPVDSVGDLYDGTRMDGPRGLEQALLKHSDVVLLSFTENLMTYALGRRVEYTDMPAIRGIIREAARHDNRMSSFVLGVVTSAAFRMANADNRTWTTDAGDAKRSNSSSR